MTSPTSTSTRPSGCRESSARLGLTLLELMLVMLLLAVLAGAGAGMFAGLDPGRRAALGLVKNVVRSTRNTAAANQASAVVRVNRERGTLAAESLVVVGTWHFENRALRGAFEIDGKADPTQFVSDGYIGDALALGSAPAEIPIDDPAGFDLSEGFLVECVLRREGLGGGQVLDICSAVLIDVGQAGEVRGRFQAAGEGASGGLRSTRITLTSPPGLIFPERWARVRLRYDRHQFLMEVDGSVVASRLETAPVRALDGPLRLSDRRHPFPGSIDNLVVHALHAEDEVALPDTCVIESSPDAIHFQAGGSLDRTQHTQPAEIVLLFEDGSRETVNVGAYGTVE